jgi:hypothetical protein
MSVQLSEPSHFWIRHVPSAWEAPDRPWIHLATGRLGESGKTGKGDYFGLAESPLDDVLYLPPVPLEQAAARDQLAWSRLERGTPVVVQLLVGEQATVEAALVIDLLAPLLAGDLAQLSRCPAGSCVAWPLVAGLTDDPLLWEEGCRLLAAAGVTTAQAVAVRLESGDRRRLAQWAGREEEAFDALFHREEPDERAFAAVAHRHGLAPFMARPLPQSPQLPRTAANLRLGGALALAGELWLRLGRGVEAGQVLCRDARWIDRSLHDVAAVVREGNLGILPLSATSRALVAELAETGRSRLLDELLAEYVQPEGAARETVVLAARET